MRTKFFTFKASGLNPDYKVTRIDPVGKGKRYYQLDVTQPKSSFSAYSITTMLDSIKNPAIEEWKKNVGLEKATRQAEIAKRQGSPLHAAAEAYLTNKPYFPEHANMPNVVSLFRKIQPVLDRLQNIRLLETPLFGKLYCSGDCYRNIAGTPDCIAEYDNTLSIVDFKTARSYKREDQIKNYFLQCAAYSYMYLFMSGKFITQYVIIIANEDAPTAQIFVGNIPDYTEQLKTIVNNFYKDNPTVIHG